MLFTCCLSASQRLLVLGSLCHLTAGAAYLALTGIAGSRVPIRRQEIGSGSGAAVAAAMVWAVVVVLWPIPWVCRTVRALRCRAGAAQPCEERFWRAQPASVVTHPMRLAAAAQPQMPPLWCRDEYEAVHSALTASPAAGAARAAALVERSVLAFGPAHTHARYAWELLAHTARLGLAERQDQPTLVPFPRAARPLDDQAAVGADGVYLPGCPYAV
ncbi:hypothetical protein [Kitasatospora sp. GAS204B]|uniref:hypothetical protein n=1 Tax=unclassified Kitasatospora TaxID=2633591 RepID=UPI002475F3A1|nr:hypothetical protein [Kitasatospora sp. GAS204B]MDH6122965.1 hypothetical protein [Kitasatospora sp. GAS204B]